MYTCTYIVYFNIVHMNGGHSQGGGWQLASKKVNAPSHPPPKKPCPLFLDWVHYCIAPNFRGTIFSWILWFDFWSRKFSLRKFSMFMVGVATCCALQRITKVRSLPYVSLLQRAFRRIESLWCKTRIRNGSALFWFIFLRIYKPQHHV